MSGSLLGIVEAFRTLGKAAEEANYAVLMRQDLWNWLWAGLMSARYNDSRLWLRRTNPLKRVKITGYVRVLKPQWRNER